MTLPRLDLPERLPGSLAERRARLRQALGSGMRAGVGRAWRDEEFNRLALAVFRYQAEASSVYARFVRNRGLDADTLDDWRAIPAIPTRAFKELPIVADASAPVDATFLTSGTTRGRGARGVHRVRDLSLYRASALSTAAHYLGLSGGSLNRTRLRLLVLAPDPRRRTDSSLAHMFGLWMQRWDDGRGAYLADSDWSLRAETVARAIEAAAGEGVPVLLAGTAFAFVRWLEMGNTRQRVPLPDGSILVETGGFKGRSREVPRAELYRDLSEVLGVERRRIVNEYGMTEMLSQFYEPVLLEGGPDDPGERRHLGPPWVRTRVLDPVTLAPVAAGEIGILCHLDLANLDSVSAILTEDRGRAVGDGFRLSGRAEGAEPRGCSLAMEELLEGG